MSARKSVSSSGLLYGPKCLTTSSIRSSIFHGTACCTLTALICGCSVPLAQATRIACWTSSSKVRTNGAERREFAVQYAPVRNPVHLAGGFLRGKHGIAQHKLASNSRSALDCCLLDARWAVLITVENFRQHEDDAIFEPSASGNDIVAIPLIRVITPEIATPPHLFARFAPPPPFTQEGSTNLFLGLYLPL